MDYLSGLIIFASFAAVPGYIAENKGHSFWLFFFLSFFITPLFSAIIAACIRKRDPIENAVGKTIPRVVSVCRNCGFELLEGNNYCSNCGTKVERDSVQ